jgi:hypothetical protein
MTPALREKHPENREFLSKPSQVLHLPLSERLHRVSQAFVQAKRKGLPAPTWSELDLLTSARSARCAHCGAKGATVMHPSWGGPDVGFVPFPADQMH